MINLFLLSHPNLSSRTFNKVKQVSFFLFLIFVEVDGPKGVHFVFLCAHERMKTKKDGTVILGKGDVPALSGTQELLPADCDLIY